MIYNCSFSNPINIGSSSEQFAFGSSTCELAAASSSIQSVYNGFSNGEIVSTVFLFLIFLTTGLTLFWSLFKIKIGK
jgi:hypothetical protein